MLRIRLGNWIIKIKDFLFNNRTSLGGELQDWKGIIKGESSLTILRIDYLIIKSG